jgi:hypothetical protein
MVLALVRRMLLAAAPRMLLDVAPRVTGVVLEAASE